MKSCEDTGRDRHDEVHKISIPRGHKCKCKRRFIEYHLPWANGCKGNLACDLFIGAAICHTRIFPKTQQNWVLCGRWLDIKIPYVQCKRETNHRSWHPRSFCHDVWVLNCRRAVVHCARMCLAAADGDVRPSKGCRCKEKAIQDGSEGYALHRISIVPRWIIESYPMQQVSKFL